MEQEESVGRQIIGCALKVHSALGPGLLESAYEACLSHELGKLDIDVKRQLPLPVVYDGLALDAGYRIDLLVGDCVVVELKSVEQLLPLHLSQVLTYLKLSGAKLGYLLNFNVPRMKHGIRRVILTSNHLRAP
jgi:GxxExxY protein